MSRWYSKRFKNRTTRKMRVYGGWYQISGDSTAKRQRRKQVLVRAGDWGYWISVPRYVIGERLEHFTY